MHDSELVALCARGQSEPFTRLVEKYQGALFGLVLQIVRNREEAEDIAQEAFVRVYQRIRAGESMEFFPYLRRTAANLALDHLRRRGTADRYLAVYGPAERYITGSAEESVMRKAEQQMLAELVSALPPMYREVIVLHYAAGLSYEEMAQALNQPLSLVRNRLFRARKLLKEQCDTEEVTSI